MPRAGTSPRLTRKLLDQREPAVLLKGASYKPDILLYRVAGEDVVVKDYAGKPWLWRTLLGRLSVRQEAQALRILGDMEGVPRFRGAPDAYSIAMSYVPAGRARASDPRVRDNEGFMRQLEKTVEEMHRRGVVHLDFKHRSNLMVSEEGRPVVIDFASALYLRESWFGGRIALALLKHMDLIALQQWKRRLCPHVMSAADRRKAKLALVIRRFWLPRKLLNILLHCAVRDRTGRNRRQAPSVERVRDQGGTPGVVRPGHRLRDRTGPNRRRVFPKM